MGCTTQLLEKAAKAAAKTHKERVAEFNEKLESLSEHYDIPKVRRRAEALEEEGSSRCCLRRSDQGSRPVLSSLQRLFNHNQEAKTALHSTPAQSRRPISGACETSAPLVD